MITVLIIILVLAAVFIAALVHLRNDPSYITGFLKDHPARSSIYFILNDSGLVATGEKKLMPLASTVKLLIAFAYTTRVSQRGLSGNERINIDDVNRFYLPGTDANAHKDWLDEMERKSILHSNLIALDEVVKE